MATYTRDVMGRTTAEYNYDAAGQIARSRTGIVYDNRDQVLSESDSQRQGSEVHLSQTGNYYGAGGVLTSTSSYASIQGQSNSATNDTTTYTYQWRDGPLTSQAVLTNKNGTTSSTYGYDGAGRLTSVALTGGQRPRTITLTTDLAGQILTRVESSAASLNPNARSYFFAGVQMGSVSNDGTDNTTFAAAIAEATVAPPATNPGPFRGGATYGSSYASFDRQHDAVNPNNATSAQSSYTVKAGDTLASVARALWGDANLWYLLAAANGLSGAEELAAGRTLNVPNKTINRANTSDTFRPYDPNEALGDVQPNTPTPKPQGKKKNKCGIFGAILLAIVAIAVAAVLTPVFSAALGGGLGGAIFGGAAAAAVGSVASQGVGLATGIQDKFSFKQVALSALGAGVSAGVGLGLPRLGLGLNEFGTKVVGAIASNAITQGVAVATGLQKKFSWAAVAAAGVGAAVGYGIGNALKATPLMGVDNGKLVLGNTSASNILANVAQRGASLLANAGTRSIIDGSDFGDNITAALPDVIAQTIVDLAASGVKANAEAKAAAKIYKTVFKQLDPTKPEELRRQVASEASRGKAGSGATFGGIDSLASFDRKNGKLTINDGLIDFAAQDPSIGGMAVYAYLEELGHWADARLQALSGQAYVDPPGDEGARFANRAVADLTNGRSGDISFSLALADGGYLNLSASTTAMKVAVASSISTGRIARDNPAGVVQTWEASGHFAQTFLFAKGVGEGLGVNDRDNGPLARKLAVLSQLADMYAQFDAKSLGTTKMALLAGETNGSVMVWTPKDEANLQLIYDGLHAIPATASQATKEWVSRERERTEEFIVSKFAARDYLSAGIALHRYGDLFSHVRDDGRPYFGTEGHTLSNLFGNSPDVLFKDGMPVNFGKAANYRQNLARVLSRGYIAAGLAAKGRTIQDGIKGGFDSFYNVYGKSSIRSDSGLVRAITDDKRYSSLRIPTPEIIESTSIRQLFSKSVKASDVISVARSLSSKKK